MVWCALLDKEGIPKEFGPREEVPIEEGVVKNEHLIPSSGSLHLWYQQAISVRCTHVRGGRKVAHNNKVHAMHTYIYGILYVV